MLFFRSLEILETKANTPAGGKRGASNGALHLQRPSRRTELFSPQTKKGSQTTTKLSAATVTTAPATANINPA